MKNKGAFYTLLLIMAAGITITTCTNYLLRGSLNTGSTAKTAYEQAIDKEAVSQNGDGGAASGGGSGAAQQEKQTRAAGGRMAKGLGAGGKEAGEAKKQEDGETAFMEQEDSAMSRSALPASGSGGEETALTSGTENIQSFALDSMAEEQLDGGFSTKQSYDFAESGTAGDYGEAAFQDGDGNEETESVLISPLETTSPQGASQKEGTVKSSYYRNRLSELDAQIQKSKENQTSNSANSASLTQSSASNELKLWDNELNVIYDAIMDRLDEKQAGELVEEERQWMKERDRLAAEAAKAFSGDAQESVEYTASLAESTRLRAYELVTAYEYLLVD